MEHKSNSYKVNRQQREKVLRYSIRKYSFGAASVAVAALMFLGARVASADSVSENTAPSAAGVVSPKDEPKSPQGIAEPTENKVDAGKNSSENQALTSAVNDAPTVDKAKLKKVVEELNSLLSTKLNLDDSVVSPVKDRLQKGKEALENSELAQKDIDELVELLSKDVTVVSVAAKESAEVQVDKQVDKTEKQAEKPASQPSSEVSASEESQTVSAKKDSLKVSVDQLQAAVLELPEHETSKEVLEKANELLGVAQGVLENTTVSLNEVEEMTKRVKRMFNSVKIATMRLTSGSHDPRNGQNMGQGSDLRSAPIDKTTKQGRLGIVVADSGFITGYATPSSTIEIKRNGQKILTSKLDDTGAFKLNAPGIKVGDKVELVVNGQSVYNTTVSQVDTVSFNDSLAGIAQVDGYTATEADVEISIGGRKYTTKSQSNGYFTVNVDKNLMVKDATITAVVKKNGKVVGSGTSNVRETRVTDFGVGWNKNPMINYSERDVYSPDTKQYAFVSRGTADKAYDNIRVYREERIEKDGNKYYYWMLDSGPAANAQAGLSKKISLTIPRTVGDPYDFTYTKYQDGTQTSHKEYANATAWEHENSNYRAYVKNGERRSGASYTENLGSWMDYAHPDNNWWRNIYRDSRQDGTNRNPDAASRVKDMYGITKGGLIYNLGRGVIEDKMNVVKGQRTIITFKTKILEGNELDQSIMSDWNNKDKSNPMLAEIKKRLANDPYLAYGGYTDLGWPRYQEGKNAIIGTLPLKPEEVAKYNIKPKAKEQSTKVGVIPDAYNSIANPKELPAGTTYRWFKDPDVSKPTAPNQPVYGKVEVIIPERGTFIVDAPVHVVDDKAQTPVATAKDNGDVTAKPQDAKKVDKIKVSFTGEDNKPKTAEGTKGANGKWTVNNTDVRIDPNTGEITIPANKVKDLTEVTAVTKNGNGADSDPAKATAKDVQKPTLTITPSSQTVVEGEKVEFTVTAKDNTSVTLNAKDFLDKYFGRMNAGKATTTPVKTTETEKVVRISITTSAEDIGKQNKITFNAADNHGNNADPVNFNFTVTARDTVGPTITANGATVTKNEPIAPISVTAVDNPGGVGLRDKNPIEVTGLPNGLTFKDGRITGTPIAGKGDYPVTITAYDKNGNHTTSNITIKVQEQADKYNPTGETLTVNQGQAISDDAVKAKVKNFAPGRLTVESKPTSTVTAGKAGNAVVKVTYPDGSHDTVNVPVTVRDVTGPTIKAEETTVTKNEEITPIPITAEDNSGGVGMRDTNPITVSNLPSGLTFKDGKITGTTSVRKGFYTLTITAYDKNNTPSTKKVRINVQEQADKYTPTATELTVNQNEDITIEKLTPKVNNPGAGTLSLVSKPSTTTAGKAGNAVVKVTYSDGSHDLVNVPITVKDVTGPTITANNATVTNREDITPISVTAKDNTGGVGMRNTNPIVVTGLPEGLTYANGQITGKPTGTAGESTVTITAYDKNDNPSTTTIKITVQSQADAHNPRGERLTVDQNHVIEDSEVIAKVKDYAPATQLTVKSKPTTENIGNPADAVVTVTYPDGSSEDVNVPVTVRDASVPDTEGPTITANGATVTKNEPIKPILVTAEDNPGGVGLRDDNPIVVEGLPNGLTFKDEKITGTPTAPAGDYPVTIKAFDKKGNSTTTTITIKVQEQKDKHNPTAEGLTVNQGHEITDDEVKAKVKDYAPGTLTVTSKPSTATVENVPNAVVTVTYPDGSSETVDVPVTVKDLTGPKITADGATVTRNEPITPIPVTVADNEGGRGLREENPVEVTGLPDGLTYANGEITGTPAKTAEKGGYTVTIKATDKDGNSTEKQITITVQTQADKYTPKYDDGNGIPGAKVEVPVTEETGKTIPEGTKFESLTPGITVDDKGKVTVTIPEDKEPGDEIPGTIKVTYPDGSKEDVPVKVTVTTPDKDIYTPEYDKENGKPGTKVEIPLKEEAGKTIPEGTKFQSNTPGITVDKDGKVTVTIPEGAKPGDKITGEITVTYPDGSKDIVPVEVTVTNQDKDIYTPEYDKENGKPGGTVELPLKEKDGKKIPSGTKFESNTPGITVDKDGKVTVTIPEGAKPGDKITGEITVTYPDGSTDTVPVEVTVTNQDKDIYTPKYEDGNGKPGAKVEIPLTEESGKKIPEGTTFESDQPGVITVDKDGKVTVTIPEGAKPGDKITGKVIVRYPDGSTEEIPVTVTVTPNADQVDTKTTMNNGAESNDSQNVLPNTGTESNATLASLGLLGLLSGFGLVARKKKED